MLRLCQQAICNAPDEHIGMLPAHAGLPFPCRPAAQQLHCRMVGAAWSLLHEPPLPSTWLLPPESKGKAMLAQKPRPVTEGEASGRTLADQETGLQPGS